MTKVNGRTSIDLGELQNSFTVTKRTWTTAETVLKKAQETRDRALAAHRAADQALRDATRTVLG